MTIVQMITIDRVGGETVPVEVEVSHTEPLRTTAKNLIAAGAKKFKSVTKQSRAYHGVTGRELTGNVELESLSGAFIVLSSKAGWKGAAQLSAAHESAKEASLKDASQLSAAHESTKDANEIVDTVDSQPRAGLNASAPVEPKRTGDETGCDQIPLNGRSNSDEIPLNGRSNSEEAMRDLLLDAAHSQRANGVVLAWKDTQDNGYLSNWGRSPLIIDGISYNCVEQWLMACKARVCNNELVREQIMATPNPRKQKGLGRSLDRKIVDRCWKTQQKWDAQLRGAKAKFQQNESLALKLLRTGQKRIGEASPSDTIYGIGLAPSDPLAQDPANWKGMNLLGKALEHVREEIRQHILAGKELASMTLPPASDAMPLAQEELDLPSSGPESSNAEEQEPCILVVCNKEPFYDWAETLCLYLQTRFQLRTHCLSINVQRLGVHDRLELENPANIIIPVGVQVTEIIAARECNARVCSSKLYPNLDHKGSMSSLDFPSDIPQIPTHVNPPNLIAEIAELSEFKSFVSRFETVILKPAEEAGSIGQRILSREHVEDLFKKSSNAPWPLDFADSVVQPYFKEHATVEFNFFALDGELIEWLCTHARGGITEDMWKNGTSLETYEGEHLNRMVEFVRNAIRLHQLQGLLEFEFLISGGEVFFLEINPRVSTSITGFDSQGFSPYIEKLVVPYLQSFGWLKDAELSHWQACRVYCPPSKRAKQFWQETYQKDWHRG